MDDFYLSNVSTLVHGIFRYFNFVNAQVYKSPHTRHTSHSHNFNDENKTVWKCAYFITLQPQANIEFPTES